MKMSPSPNNGMGMMDDKSEMSVPPETGTMTKGAMTAGPAAMGMKDDQGEMGGMSSGGDRRNERRAPGRRRHGNE